MSVALKNDPDQVARLVGEFDFAVVEECFAYEECAKFSPFVRAGKAVFKAEYEGALSSFCPEARRLRFSAIEKGYDPLRVRSSQARASAYWLRPRPDCLGAGRRQRRPNSPLRLVRVQRRLALLGEQRGMELSRRRAAPAIAVLGAEALPYENWRVASRHRSLGRVGERRRSAAGGDRHLPGSPHPRLRGRRTRRRNPVADGPAHTQLRLQVGGVEPLLLANVDRRRVRDEPQRRWHRHLQHQPYEETNCRGNSHRSSGGACAARPSTATTRSRRSPSSSPAKSRPPIATTTPAQGRRPWGLPGARGRGRPNQATGAVHQPDREGSVTNGLRSRYTSPDSSPGQTLGLKTCIATSGSLGFAGRSSGALFGARDRV